MTVKDSFTDQAALLGAALAGAVSVVSSDGKYDLGDTVIGIILILILKGWASYKTLTNSYQHFAFDAVWGLCLTLILMGVVDQFVINKYQSISFLGAWIGFSVVVHFFMNLPRKVIK